MNLLSGHEKIITKCGNIKVGCYCSLQSFVIRIAGVLVLLHIY
jgi:hypothetical protein